MWKGNSNYNQKTCNQKDFLVKGLQHPWILTFSCICISLRNQENLRVKYELSFSEKVILSSGNTTTTYQLPEISLKHDAIYDEPYATMTSKSYTETKSTPNT